MGDCPVLSCCAPGSGVSAVGYPWVAPCPNRACFRGSGSTGLIGGCGCVPTSRTSQRIPAWSVPGGAVRMVLAKLPFVRTWDSLRWRRKESGLLPRSDPGQGKACRSQTAAIHWRGNRTPRTAASQALTSSSSHSRSPEAQGCIRRWFPKRHLTGIAPGLAQTRKGCRRVRQRPPLALGGFRQSLRRVPFPPSSHARRLE